MDSERRKGMATAMGRKVYGFSVSLESQQVRQFIHAFTPNRKMTES
jgi:hypothetical protein